MSSCDRTFLPLSRNFFLWQENSSCIKISLLVTRNLCPRLDIPFCDKKLLPVAIHCLQCPDVSSCDKKIFPSCCVWQEIQEYLEAQFVPKERALLQKFHGSLAPWLPGSRGISHPVVKTPNLSSTQHKLNLYCSRV